MPKKSFYKVSNVMNFSIQAVVVLRGNPMLSSAFIEKLNKQTTNIRIVFPLE